VAERSQNAQSFQRNGLDTDESGPNTVTNASAGSFVPLITGGIDGTLSFAFAPLGGNPAVQTVSNGPPCEVRLPPSVFRTCVPSRTGRKE
jgi:hypothetical protein